MTDTSFSDPSDTGKGSSADTSKQQQIFQVLARIPPGKVVTYGQLAQLAGLPGYARFVGTTLKHLPQESQLPWHRVINARGQISLPAETEGYERQRARLLAEGIRFSGKRINLKQYQWQPGLSVTA